MNSWKKHCDTRQIDQGPLEDINTMISFFWPTVSAPVLGYGLWEQQEAGDALCSKMHLHVRAWAAGRGSHYLLWWTGWQKVTTRHTWMTSLYKDQARILISLSLHRVFCTSNVADRLLDRVNAKLTCDFPCVPALPELGPTGQSEIWYPVLLSSILYLERFMICCLIGLTFALQNLYLWALLVSASCCH